MPPIRHSGADGFVTLPRQPCRSADAVPAGESRPREPFGGRPVPVRWAPLSAPPTASGGDPAARSARLERRLGVVALVLVAGWVAVAGGAYSYDDAFITYRMSANLAAGHGFVYNPGEWHLGSTAALYGLILAALGWLFGASVIPAASGAISSASMLATGLILPALGAGADDAAAGRRAGVAAGLLYAASPLLFVTFGGEMPFLIALVAAAFLAEQRGRGATAAVLAALAAVTRPDGVQAIAVVLATMALRRRRLPWREALIAGAVLLPFLGLAWHAYGSPLPSTLQAKLAQRDSGLWTSFGRGLVDWLRLFLWDSTRPNLGFAPVTPPTLWAWIAVGLAAIWRVRVFLPLLAWTAIFTGSYTLLRAPFYHWYAAPPALGLCLLGGAGLAWAIDRLASSLAAPQRRAIAASVAGIAAAIAISLPPLLALPRTSRLNDNVRLYIEAGRWLAAETRPGSRVGYYEIGYIGFYGRRPMVDALGLIDPSIAPAVRTHDFARAFRVARPDYILEKPGAGLNTFLAEPWFAEEYRFVTELRVGGEGLRIHRRR